MTTVLSVWAHPDDESFGPAALLRALHEANIRNVMITATHGEQGQLGDPPQATRATLAAVRAKELRQACAIMGIDRLELWDYADGSLKDVDASELRERILALIVAEQPAVVITFGPDGIYGHPDHMAISAATTQAFAQYIANHAQDVPPRLYYVTPSPDMLEQPIENDAGDPNAPPPLPPTALIDVSAYADAKLAALKAHATQNGDWGKMLSDPERGDWLTCVYLHRAYPPVAANEPPETELFA